MCDLLVSIAKRNGFLELNAGDVASTRRACLRGGKPAGFSTAVRAIYNVGHKYVELDERWLAGKRRRLRWREHLGDEHDRGGGGRGREGQPGEERADGGGGHAARRRGRGGSGPASKGGHARWPCLPPLAPAAAACGPWRAR